LDFNELKLEEEPFEGRPALAIRRWRGRGDVRQAK
jgi:hypothetical protein